ncbi:hypothetical protein [Pantoea sp. 18069]|uniref:hypothetical protein n=1 Tax=Pantoea sp. 18069 TaxID=2681415 RepID=UPI0013575234|nr:hypothetical protein [Pantoea sp. 18069]
MTVEAPTKPTLAERLASASNSRDLSVNVDTRTDADYLISSGIQPAKLGRLVYQLMSEWDARLKPRALTDADIERVAEQMPRLVKKTKDRRGERVTESLDIAGARASAALWHQQQRREILEKLPAFRKLMDRHAGFRPWVLALGIEDARSKLVDVLLWWCDRRCQTCGGTNLAKGKTCKVCHGFGTRDVPHGADGLRISEHIAAEVDASRAGTAAVLKRMKALKKFASGQS